MLQLYKHKRLKMHITYLDYKSSVAAPDTGWSLFFIGHVYGDNYCRLLNKFYTRRGTPHIKPLLKQIKRNKNFSVTSENSL